jgi:hypothetical protein
LEVEVVVTIDSELNPTPEFNFALQLDYCVGSTPVALPTTSDNGFTGTWNPEAILTNAEGTTTYTFTPDDECALEVEVVVTITDDCGYTITGTMFPFVHTGDEIFDNQFEIKASLYNIPPENALDKIGYIRKQTPVQTVMVTYYDCDNDDPIVGAPKYPGTIGATNNPGLDIRWGDLGVIDPSIPNDDTLTETDNCPTAHIGKFTFENIAVGDYVIEISRLGFLTRYGIITVEGDDYIGHRELLGGDVNGDLMINDKDLSAIRSKMGIYGSTIYDWKYELNGDKSIDAFDANVIRINLGAYCTIYQETFDFITNL